MKNTETVMFTLTNETTKNVIGFLSKPKLRSYMKKHHIALIWPYSLGFKPNHNGKPMFYAAEVDTIIF
jgi:hypothetical protein